MQTRINIKQNLITIIIELAESFRVEEVRLSGEYRSVDTFGLPDPTTYKPGIASGMVRGNSSIATDRGRRHLSLITGDSAFI